MYFLYTFGIGSGDWAGTELPVFGYSICVNMLVRLDVLFSTNERPRYALSEYIMYTWKRQNPLGSGKKGATKMN